jgi:uncharacterized membrane protein
MFLLFPRDFLSITGLFFMRGITNFCAPVFFPLTGTGAYLSLRRKSKRELSRFLFTRGLCLIVPVNSRRTAICPSSSILLMSIRRFKED